MSDLISFQEADKGSILLTWRHLEEAPAFVLKDVEAALVHEFERRGGGTTITIEDTMDGKLVRWYPTPPNREGEIYTIER